ncbi:hypothetical protein D3C74_415930 [compost metagenome]
MIRNIAESTALLHDDIVAEIIEWHRDCIVLGIDGSTDILPLRVFRESEHRYSSPSFIHNILVKG